MEKNTEKEQTDKASVDSLVMCEDNCGRKAHGMYWDRYNGWQKLCIQCSTGSEAFKPFGHKPGDT